jgi:hypothetical protein
MKWNRFLGLAKVTIVTLVLAISLLILAGCPDPNGVNSGTVTITFPATEAPLVVSARDLTALIPAPVTGQWPTTFFETPQYNAGIEWQTSGGTPFYGSFEAGTVYQARFTPAVQDGYTLDGIPANSFTHSGATSVTNAANSGTVTIIFPATEALPVVNARDLTALIPAPVKYQWWPTGYIETAQYYGHFEWQMSDGTPLESSFVEDTVYKVVATLNATDGYTFNGIPANSFSYTGATSVTNEANSGVVTITFVIERMVVSARDLTALVTAPVKGEAPAINGFYEAQFQYYGSVAWQTSTGAAHSGSFAAGTVYKAVVTLSAQDGYTFDGVPANSFSYTGATSVTNEANSGTVTITFPATEAPLVVSARNLNELVITPVRGEARVAGGINTVQYTGTVAWQTSDGTPFDSYFAASTVYKAVVTLSAQDGYTFDGVPANSFSYTGATSVTNAADSGTVTITFPATEAPPVVNARNLTALIPAPVRGQSSASYWISEAQYHGFAVWQTSDGMSVVTSYFEAGRVYKAEVTLSADSGYTFDGIPANSFSYTGATSVTNAANSGTVTITFPATEAMAVSARDLTGLVTAPVRGAAPVTTAINAAQYTGSVAWQTSSGAAHSGSFAASTVYKAVVTLSAEIGYTFDGVAANSFSYTGATSVSNAANSGTVTITFPATEMAIGGAGVTVLPPAIPGDALIGLTGPAAPVVWLNGTITASVTNAQEFTGAGFSWYIDGALMSGQTSATLAANARNYALGAHTLTVIATKSDGTSYSKSVNFTIVKE